MAFKNVSFYGQGPLNAIQSDYARDPRRQMETQLMQQGASTAPVQSPLEGLARALTAGVGGLSAGAARREKEGRKTAASESMQKMIAAMSGPELTAGAGSPPSAKYKGNVPGDGIDGAIRAYDGNEDTAQAVQQMQMQKYQQEYAARQAAAGRAADMKDFAEQERIKSQYKTPKDTRTPAMINAEAIGGAPGTPGYMEALKNLTKKTPLIGGEMEKEEDKAFGKELVKQYSTIQEAANVSENAINQIEQARAFTDTDDAGVSLPSVLQQKVGNVITALGGDVTSPGTAKILGNITNGQQFVAVTKNIVLSKMQAQKGPQTAADTAMIEKTVASLGNTPEARDFLLRSAQAVASEDMFKADFWRNHKNSTGSFNGAAGEWAKFRNKVPFLAVSKGTGKPVFFADFVRANRGADMGELIQDWTANYGK